MKSGYEEIGLEENMTVNEFSGESKQETGHPAYIRIRENGLIADITTSSFLPLPPQLHPNNLDVINSN